MHPNISNHESVPTVNMDRYQNAQYTILQSQRTGFHNPRSQCKTSKLAPKFWAHPIKQLQIAEEKIEPGIERKRQN